MGGRKALLILLAAASVMATACTSTVAGAPTAARATDAGAAPPSEAAAAPEPITLPPGATAGLDDFNEDGEPDPTCTNQDYGGGLVVRLLCTYADYASPPTEDTTLVPNSLAGLPNPKLDLSNISGNVVQGRTGSGQQLFVIFINSDTLFALGSATLSEPAKANFDAIAELVRGKWPGAPIQVRGHTDATGSVAGNQTLSEQRAATVADYLGGRGLDRSKISVAGLGQQVPIVAETKADGSVNTTGQQYNRRVELAIVVP